MYSKKPHNSNSVELIRESEERARTLERGATLEWGGTPPDGAKESSIAEGVRIPN